MKYFIDILHSLCFILLSLRLLQTLLNKIAYEVGSSTHLGKLCRDAGEIRGIIHYWKDNIER